MNSYPRKNNNALRLLAGWCGLVLYAGAFSPLGVLAVGLLGTIDPDHHALLQSGAAGMRLVLHHEGGCSAHRHHAVARALTLLAQPTGDTDPDHVVQFADEDCFLRGTQLTVCNGDFSEQPQLIWAESIISLVSQPVFPLPLPAPPPDASGDLLNVRSTVLLI